MTECQQWGISIKCKGNERKTGLEPATYGLGSRRSAK